MLYWWKFPTLIVLVVLLISSFVPGLGTHHAQVTSFPEDFSQTVYLPGGNRSVKVSEPLGSEQISSATPISLEIQTPSTLGTGPEGLRLTNLESSVLWAWTGGFGYTSEFGNDSYLQAINGTSSAMIEVPPVQVESGTATLESTSGELSGDYTLNLSVGGTTRVLRSGANGFLFPKPVSWASSATGTPITAVTESIEPNGTNLLALGDESGAIQFYRVVPGSNGIQVYNATIEVTASVNSLATSDLFGTGVPFFLAGSGQYVYVSDGYSRLNPADASVQIEWNRSAPTYPQVIGVAGGQLGKEPTIVALTSEGSLQVSSWSLAGSGQGWQDPMIPVKQFPFQPTTFSSCTNTSTGDIIVAVGGSNFIQVYQLSALGLSEVANDSFTSSGGPTASSFINGTLVVGTSNGAAMSFSPPSYFNATPILTPEGTAVTSIVGTPGAPPGSASVGFGDGNISFAGGFAVRRAPTVMTNIGTLPLPMGVEGMGVGPIFGVGESDLLIPGESTLYSALSELSFNSTVVSNWSSVINGAEQSGQTKFDAYGNALIQIPVSVSVHGGGARVTNQDLYYRFYKVITLTSTETASLVTGNQTARSIAFYLASERPGWVNATISIGNSGNSGTPTAFLLQIYTYITRYWTILTAATLIAGSFVFAIGYFKYSPSSQASHKKSPDRFSSNSEGVKKRRYNH